MRYKPPRIENKEQWVPIVVKNKDWLVGYICGVQFIQSLIENSLEENGVEIDFRGLDLCLDSSRFNDVMEDGRRESECTDNEIKKYFEKIIEEKISMIKDHHPDNEAIFDDCFLKVECVCGLGIYTFKDSKEIPETQFKCSICGRVVIDYTEKDDEEFEYDGDSSNRVSLISEEITKNFEEQTKEDEEEDEEENF